MCTVNMAKTTERVQGAARAVKRHDKQWKGCRHLRFQFSIVNFHERGAVPLGATECIPSPWGTAGAAERR